MDRNQILKKICELEQGCQECPYKLEESRCGECLFGVEIYTAGEELIELKEKRIEQILTKGPDMTKKELTFLLNKKVNKRRIIKSLKIGDRSFYQLMENWNLTGL